MAATDPAYTQQQARLARVEQQHVLSFYPELDARQRSALLAQIASLDVESLPALVRDYVLRKPRFEIPEGLEPAPYFPASGAGWDKPAMRRAGEDLLRRGKIAAFVVAGGQGSRLGFEGPKGCFPAGCVTRKPLFQIFAENLLYAKDTLGVSVPWYIMTSPLNHAATVSFFEANRHFGLAADDVMFFPQGVLASLDIGSGKMLMASRGEIATNPDGHGGSIRALKTSGALADMKRRGVEHVSYFQVDNPLVRVLDPEFIGLHAAGRDSSAEMSSKMVPKVYAEEKMGVFCRARGKVEVIEYSDLPMELQRETLPGGSLRFVAGSIAIHMMGREFLERVNDDPRLALPYHRAEKKIPCVDLATGASVNPASNNGVKLERFVFDALPMCRSSIVLETVREDEFAPIKNASGVDSVESSAAMQTARAARWLESAGLRVPRRPDGTPDCTLEISARHAGGPEDMTRLRLPGAIERGARVAI